jgi:hypothetical protein
MDASFCHCVVFEPKIWILIYQIIKKLKREKGIEGN